MSDKQPIEKQSNDYALLEDRFQLIQGANWVELNGRFTPNELRKIAREIEKAYKKVPKSGKQKAWL